MNNQFSVSYNGHPVAVTVLDNEVYVVQISYKPNHLQLRKDNEGCEYWVDMETNMETAMSKQMGYLISEYLLTHNPS
jgi:hypothetical protein